MLAPSKPRPKKTLRAPSIICRRLEESASATTRREVWVSATIGLAFGWISELRNNSEGNLPYIIGVGYILTEPFGQCYLGEAGRFSRPLSASLFFIGMRGPSWPQRETRRRGSCAPRRTPPVTRPPTKLPLKLPIPLARIFPMRPPAVPTRRRIAPRSPSRRRRSSLHR